MDYFLLSDIISEIGGTASSIFGIIATIMGIIYSMNWEKNVLFSVFGKIKIDDSQIILFKQRLSYLGLYQLHSETQDLKSKL